MSGTERQRGFRSRLGISQSRHELSHHSGDPEIHGAVSRSDAFLAQQFPYFLDQLVAIKDGEDALPTHPGLFGSA